MKSEYVLVFLHFCHRQNAIHMLQGKEKGDMTLPDSHLPVYFIIPHGVSEMQRAEGFEFSKVPNTSMTVVRKYSIFVDVMKERLNYLDL